MARSSSPLLRPRCRRRLINGRLHRLWLQPESDARKKKEKFAAATSPPAAAPAPASRLRVTHADGIALGGRCPIRPLLLPAAPRVDRSPPAVAPDPSASPPRSSAYTASRAAGPSWPRLAHLRAAAGGALCAWQHASFLRPLPRLSALSTQLVRLSAHGGSARRSAGQRLTLAPRPAARRWRIAWQLPHPLRRLYLLMRSQALSAESPEQLRDGRWLVGPVTRAETAHLCWSPSALPSRVPWCSFRKSLCVGRSAPPAGPLDAG